MVKGKILIESQNITCKRLLFSIVIPLIILGFIIWHTILWSTSGVLYEMFGWSGTDRAYLAVLYNLALMLITGTILGILTGELTKFVSWGIREFKYSGKENRSTSSVDSFPDDSGS